MVSIYVDTNIVSGLVDRDFPQATSDDFFAALELCRSGRGDLFASELVLEELRQHHDPHTRELVYRLLGATQLHQVHISNLASFGFGGGAQSIVTMGLGRNPDRLHVRLTEIIERPSAESRVRAWEYDIGHLFQCGKNSIDVFWTEDRRTILRHRDALGDLGIDVQSTEQLLETLRDTG